MAHNVQVNANKSNVVLPDGRTYTTGGTPRTVTLTNEQFALVNPVAFTDGTLTDLGPAATTGDAVVTQAIDIANIATVDATDLASAIALSNANKAKINALLNALRGTGKAMA